MYNHHEVKDHVRDKVEAGFDKLHRIADVVTYPIAPLDGAIHGAARGILNWLVDVHPEKKNTNAHSFWPPQQQQQYPQYGGQYGYPNNPPPSPPSPPSYGGQYWPGPGQEQPRPYYGSQGIQNVENGNNNNSNHNNGAIKVANYGGA